MAARIGCIAFGRYVAISCALSAADAPVGSSAAKQVPSRGTKAERTLPGAVGTTTTWRLAPGDTRAMLDAFGA
jgi:hypothetical protein